MNEIKIGSIVRLIKVAVNYEVFQSYYNLLGKVVEISETGLCTVQLIEKGKALSERYFIYPGLGGNEVDLVMS